MALEFYGLRKFAIEKRRTGKLRRIGIPKALHEKLGWEAGALIEVWGDPERGAVVLRKAPQTKKVEKGRGRCA